MIVKFFAGRGSGSARSSTDYLLGPNGNRPGAKVLRGNARETALLADSLKFKNRFSVGCLSFEEGDISPEAKEEIMDEFERAMFADLERDRYNILWVEHKDKGRLELNFLIPKVDLKTGRSITPYLKGKDTPRVEAFKDYTNAKYNLTDPNNPTKARQTKIPDNLPRDKKALLEAVNNSVIAMASIGELSSRQDVINHLTKSGIEVTRETNKAISIADPSGGRNIRLKGAVYESEFAGYNGKFREEYAERIREYQESRTERVAAARNKFEELVKRKGREYQQRTTLCDNQNDERGRGCNEAAFGDSERLGRSAIARGSHNGSGNGGISQFSNTDDYRANSQRNRGGSESDIAHAQLEHQEDSRSEGSDGYGARNRNGIVAGGRTELAERRDQAISQTSQEVYDGNRHSSGTIIHDWDGLGRGAKQVLLNLSKGEPDEFLHRTTQAIIEYEYIIHRASNEREQAAERRARDEEERIRRHERAAEAARRLSDNSSSYESDIEQREQEAKRREQELARIAEQAAAAEQKQQQTISRSSGMSM